MNQYKYALWYIEDHRKEQVTYACKLKVVFMEVV